MSCFQQACKRFSRSRFQQYATHSDACRVLFSWWKQHRGEQEAAEGWTPKKIKELGTMVLNEQTEFNDDEAYAEFDQQSGSCGEEEAPSFMDARVSLLSEPGGHPGIGYNIIQAQAINHTD